MHDTLESKAPVRHFHDTLISDVQVDCFLYPVFILNVHTYKYHNLLFLLQKYSPYMPNYGRRGNEL